MFEALTWVTPLFILHDLGAKIPAKKLLVEALALASVSYHGAFALNPIVLVITTCSPKADDIAHAAVDWRRGTIERDWRNTLDGASKRQQCNVTIGAIFLVFALGPMNILDLKKPSILEED